MGAGIGAGLGAGAAMIYTGGDFSGFSGGGGLGGEYNSNYTTARDGLVYIEACISFPSPRSEICGLYISVQDRVLDLTFADGDGLMALHVGFDAA